MDRNYIIKITGVWGAVALRKESVDRNKTLVVLPKKLNRVALRKESVDRNSPGKFGLFAWLMSLSARRAWIEIITPTKTPIGCV